MAWPALVAQVARTYGPTVAKTVGTTALAAASSALMNRRDDEGVDSYSIKYGSAQPDHDGLLDRLKSLGQEPDEKAKGNPFAAHFNQSGSEKEQGNPFAERGGSDKGTITFGNPFAEGFDKDSINADDQSSFGSKVGVSALTAAMSGVQGFREGGFGEALRTAAYGGATAFTAMKAHDAIQEVGVGKDGQIEGAGALKAAMFGGLSGALAAGYDKDSGMGALKAGLTGAATALAADRIQDTGKAMGFEQYTDVVATALQGTGIGAALADNAGSGAAKGAAFASIIGSVDAFKDRDSAINRDDIKAAKNKESKSDKDDFARSAANVSANTQSAQSGMVVNDPEVSEQDIKNLENNGQFIADRMRESFDKLVAEGRDPGSLPTASWGFGAPHPELYPQSGTMYNPMEHRKAFGFGQPAPDAGLER